MNILEKLNTPIFSAEGIPSKLDYDNYKLRIDGLVENELILSFEDIKAMSFKTYNKRLTSVSGFTVRAKWTGVPLDDLLKKAGLKSNAKYLLSTSAGGYTSCVPLSEVTENKVCLVCYLVDNELLGPKYGGPVRLFIPHLWGYKSTKYLVMLSLIEKYIKGYWESRGYTDSAEIEPGMTYDVNSGKRKQIKGGEVTEF
ncbi:MAG: molybdopterin-dependent oxidoreductase [Candidatus Coatesbacteria bacterium]|nr:molybdopterin-dependent oxidoreductase [Candidatus Coatesbacteria bacterium]